MEMEEQSVASSVRQDLEQVSVPSESAQPIVQVEEDVALVEDDYSFKQQHEQQHVATMQESSQRAAAASLQESNIHSLSLDPEAPVPQEPSPPTASTENPYNLMDDHEQLASWAIHLALIIFGGLVCLAVILAFLVIHQYGFIAISALALLLLLFVGLALFVNTILKHDARLEPVRQKLQGFANTVQQMVHDEIFAFKFEWGQYLLLTNEDAGTNDSDPSKTTTPSSSSIPEPKKKKSVVFRMIKPFLKARKRVFGRKPSKQKKNTEMIGTSYEPPTTTAAAAATSTMDAGVPV